MADTKTTALTENTAPIATDIMYMVDDPGGSAASQKVLMSTLQSLPAVGIIPGGRLTLTTATPVTTADVNGAATLYYTPYIHDRIGLYDGTSWRSVSFTEKSITLVGTTASKPYDVWGYLSSGTLALELLVWTNATTRATALAYQDGRLVKAGDATRRYLGTIYVNSSGGQTDDALLKRNVFNYYNRVERPFSVIDTTNTWTYTTATWRSWNNSAANRVELMVGVSEDVVKLYFTAHGSHSVAGYARANGVGLDITNGDSSGRPGFHASPTNNAGGAGTAYFEKLVAAGFHFLQLVEYSETGGGSTATWWGDVGVTYVQSGAVGYMMG